MRLKFIKKFPLSPTGQLFFLCLTFVFPSLVHAATQNAANQRYTNNADGFALGGGATARTLTVTGGDVTITGSGANTYTYPGSSTTLVGVDSTQTLTNKTWNGVTIGVPYGGTGASSLTGILEGNGSSAITALTGTSNYVARWSSANAIGTGVLYDDGTNVGVGTSSPASQFHVNLGSNNIALFGDASGIVANGTWFGSGGFLSQSSQFQITTTAGLSAPMVFLTGGTRNSMTPGTERMRITYGGNVGIGSTAPSGALDVGSGSICLGHVCDSTWPSGGGSNYWSLTAGAGNVGISTTNTVGIGTTSAGAGAGLVVMNGNVGIGTWVPANQLHIISPAGTTNGISIDLPTSASGNYGTGIDFGTNDQPTTNGDSGLANFVVTATNYSTVGEFTPDSMFFQYWGTGKMMFVNRNLAPMEFLINGYQSTAEAMYIDTNRNIDMGLNGGNVGIGTIAPAANLQIGSTASVSTATPSTLDMGGSFADAPVSSKAKWKLYSDGTPINTYGIGISLSQMNFFKLTGGSYNWYFSDAEQMRLTSTGNLGIGSTAPSGALDVGSGSICLGHVCNSTWPSGGSDGWSTGAGTVYTTTLSNNVGVGTTAPAARFEVYSNGGAGTGMDLQLTSSSSYVPIDFNTPSGLGGQFVLTGSGFSNGSFGGDELALASELTNGILHLGSIGSNGIIEFTTGGNTTANNRMIITSAGNIGIGSAAPSGALDVGSGAICLGHTCNSAWPATGSNYWSLTAGAGNVGISTTNTVGIGTTAGVGAGLVVMNGNVGIGTWVPSQKLEVKGSIKANTAMIGTSVLDNSSYFKVSDTDRNLSGVSQPNLIEYLGSVPSNVDNIFLGDNNQSSSRTTFIVSNSGDGAWQDNFMSINVDGASFTGNYYPSTIGAPSDAGKGILNFQGSRVTEALIGTQGNANLGFYTNSTLALTIDTGGNASIAGALSINGYGGIDPGSNGLFFPGGMEIGDILTVDTKIQSSGGYDPPYVLLDTHTQSETIDRMDYEIPVEKRSGLTLYWDGTHLNGLTVDANGNGTAYQIQMTETGTFKMPNKYNTKSKNLYYWDAQTQTIKAMIIGTHDGSRKLPKGKRVDHDTGKIISK